MTTRTDIKAVIFGCSGLYLTSEEKDLFKKHNPLGLIIFDRNVKDPDQLKSLIKEFRETVGRLNAPVLVDQEGGRVTRLWPPYWTGLGWNRTYGDWAETDINKAITGVQNHAQILAEDLLSVGIDVDCWPCLDVATQTTHEIMSKRCFSDKPQIVGELGREAVKTALKNGLMPIIKHMPGYGRTQVDPHKGLPIVHTDLKTLRSSDFVPFKHIKTPVWGMTAHVVYTALDAEKPATLSQTVLNYIRTELNFDGFLICDDISMGALTQFGTLVELSQEILTAGCDCVLHCNGNLDEMKQIAENIPFLTPQAIERLNKAEELRHG